MCMCVYVYVDVHENTALVTEQLLTCSSRWRAHARMPIFGE